MVTRAIVLSGLLAAAANAQVSFSGLGLLPGRDATEAHGVSADGRVVVGLAALGPNNVVGVRWTRDAGLESLGTPPGNAGSVANGASADGSTIVGLAGFPVGGAAGRWTESQGWTAVGPPTSRFATAASADASVIVGGGRTSTNSPFAFRWSASNGFQQIPDTPGGGHPGYSSAVSADGSIAVGVLAFPGPVQQAFYWTEAEGTVPLGHVVGSLPTSALGISADGAVIVGQAGVGGPNGARAARWTHDAGWELLSTMSSIANAANADGSRIVGANNQRAAIFQDDGTIVDLRTLLTSVFFLDLAGWELSVATDISDDGRVIVGTGTHNGVTEGWVAVIPAPGPAMLGALAGAWAVRRRRHA